MSAIVNDPDRWTRNASRGSLRPIRKFWRYYEVYGGPPPGLTKKKCGRALVSPVRAVRIELCAILPLLP